MTLIVALVFIFVYSRASRGMLVELPANELLLFESCYERFEFNARNILTTVK
jgi:hypothetical protein